MKAILTVGVSASGKSTWAEQFVNDKKLEGEQWLVINQDEIRLALIKEQKGTHIDEKSELRQWDYNPEGESENAVKTRWDKLVDDAIRNDYAGIIISDTNLDGGGKKIEKMVAKGIALENIHKQEFTISFEEALERDTNRKFSVGAEVLKMQFERLAKYKNMGLNENKPKLKP